MRFYFVFSKIIFLAFAVLGLILITECRFVSTSEGLQEARKELQDFKADLMSQFQEWNEKLILIDEKLRMTENEDCVKSTKENAETVQSSCAVVKKTELEFHENICNLRGGCEHIKDPNLKFLLYDHSTHPRIHRFNGIERKAGSKCLLQCIHIGNTYLNLDDLSDALNGCDQLEKICLTNIRATGRFSKKRIELPGLKTYVVSFTADLRDRNYYLDDFESMKNSLFFEMNMQVTKYMYKVGWVSLFYVDRERGILYMNSLQNVSDILESFNNIPYKSLSFIGDHSIVNMNILNTSFPTVEDLFLASSVVVLNATDFKFLKNFPQLAFLTLHTETIPLLNLNDLPDCLQTLYLAGHFTIQGNSVKPFNLTLLQLDNCKFDEFILNNFELIFGNVKRVHFACPKDLINEGKIFSKLLRSSVERIDVHYNLQVPKNDEKLISNFNSRKVRDNLKKKNGTWVWF